MASGNKSRTSRSTNQHLTMKLRQYLFEFEDLSWFPNTIRESMTDYLRYLISLVQFYQPIIPLILEGMKNTNTSQIIDLCSGGGGSIEQVYKGLNEQSNDTIRIILTDKFPNVSAYTFLEQKTQGGISYSAESVDAGQVDQSLTGFRTIFSGIHHFDEAFTKKVLKDAVDSKAGIGIFDGGDKNILAIFFILIFQPITFFFLTPFFKPFRFSRLVFTYLIPIIPFCTMWDGIVSITRLYHPNQLLKLAQEVDNTNYTWKAGKKKSGFGMHITYLVGYPKS